MFVKRDGKLFWKASDGSLIGPLDAGSPTCGDYQENQP